jgi:heat shock protein HtpX
MAGLLAAMGWLIAGRDGMVITFAFGLGLFLFTPRITPGLMLRLYGAQRLADHEAPELYGVARALAERAGLSNPPTLYYVPSLATNAFSVGERDDANIAVSAGLLRTLTLRQITGVLAHEISHIRNNDMRIMALADMASRLTGLMAQVGIVMLIFNLPLLLLGLAHVSWLLVLLLIAAPALSALMQLALSRQREFQADLDAAMLSGDPAALASALQALEMQQGAGGWERILLPGRRLPDPSILRTHPLTSERVRRLMDLEAKHPVHMDEHDRRLTLPGPLPRAPRWRWSGLWH